MIETLWKPVASLMRHLKGILAITLLATGTTAFCLWSHPRPVEANMVLNDTLYAMVFDATRPPGPLQHLHLARSPMLSARVTARLKEAGLITKRFPSSEAIFRVSRVSSTVGPVSIQARHESTQAVLTALTLWAEEYRSCVRVYRAQTLRQLYGQMVQDETVALAMYDATTRRFRQKITEGGGVSEEAARQLSAREMETLVRQCRLDVLHVIDNQFVAFSVATPAAPAASPGRPLSAEQCVLAQIQDKIAELISPPLVGQSPDVRGGLLVAIGLGVFMLACAGAAGLDRRRGDE
jgi:hypothetical protein